MPGNAASITKKLSVLAAGLLLAFGLSLAASAPQQAMANELTGGKVSTQNAIHAQSKAKVPSGAKNYRGHAYYVYSGLTTWTSAKKKCKAVGGHLATITSQGEQNFIASLKSSDMSVWLGGYCKSNRVWHWVTGEKWSYQNWKSGEPNADFGGTETKLGTWPVYWNDFTNNAGLGSNSGYICEWDNIVTDVRATSIARKSLKVAWGKQPGATKYQVQYRVKGGAWKLKTVKKATVSLKKLKPGTKYQVKVRAYSKKGFERAKGKKAAYGAWSATKTLKTTR